MSDACPNFSFVVSQDLLCLICTLDQKWTLSDISDGPITLTKLKLKPGWQADRPAAEIITSSLPITYYIGCDNDK